MVTTLADVLNGHLKNQGWSFERLAKEAGLPRNTVYRWTQGEVTKIRHWQDLAKIARTLDLNRSQTDALLEAGGHPPIEVLLDRTADAADRDLLARWTRSTPNNLPAPLTSFVGRQQELHRITHLISAHRLVTLTGPGGSGKTRLALEAAHAVLDDFDEVCFVDLAPIRDPELVILAISEALRLRESPDEPPMLALQSAIRDRKVLLLLDNFEQVVEAAPLVAELLMSTSPTKALVTSRTRLNVRGEHEVAVPPLPLPSLAASLESLRRNPSVTMFVDRARASDAGFTLTPGNARLVAEVCARLDGLPLGIELAAARTRQVRLESMLGRFPGRLALASAGPRDAPGRQRTLRATIAWSCDLLASDLQHLLGYASVFAGGFTEAAIESVRAAIGQVDILVPEGLESLVEQNLLRRTWGEDDEPRYEMLETIREYGRETLRARGELETVTAATAAYYVGLAERAELEGSGQAYWLPRLIAEHDNFRSALRWYRERGRTDMGLRLTLALMPLWQLRDHQVEARTWLDTFMAAASDVPAGLRAKGLLWQGMLLLRRTGDDIAASRLFAKALVLFRETGDRDGTSETLQAEGDVYRQRREWERARQRYTESLELAHQAGNDYLVAHGNLGLALCAQEEDRFDDAHHHWQLALEWAERSKNDASVALALNSLGEMARHRNDWDQAERYYERALHLAKELGSEFRMALALHNLGYVALHRGEPGTARRHFTESLSLYADRQYRKGKAECLAGLGKVEVSAGRPERAARLCGASEAILEQMGARLDTLDQADFERTLAALRSQLGGRLEANLDEGRAMSIDEAVTYAVTGHSDINDEKRPASAMVRDALPIPGNPA